MDPACAHYSTLTSHMLVTMRQDVILIGPALLSLTAAVDLGLVEAVGVCNYKIPQLQQFHSLMLARDIPLASNQVDAPSI